MLKEREDFYIELIKNSESFLEVCRKANISQTTGNYDTLKKIVKNNNISISHFKRCGGHSSKERPLEDYLNNKFPINTYRLKKRILDSDLKECKCERCGNTEWMGEKIPLELHHINGDNTDNRLENLQLLCPNCHTLTNNYGGRNQKYNIKQKIKKDKKELDVDEKIKIIEASKKCSSVSAIIRETKHNRRTINKVLADSGIVINKRKELKEKTDGKMPLILDLIRKTKSYTKTAREFNVTETSIRRLLARKGYPKHIKELLEFLKEEDGKIS